MELEKLDMQLIRTVRECLLAAASGGFFPDWEFDTLTGFSRNEIEKMAEVWPNGETSPEDAIGAAVSVLSNLLNYPGMDSSRLEAQVGATVADLVRHLETLRGIATS
jgi:hypothetical protein